MIWVLLAGMFAVTYLPRLIPFLLGRRLELPSWLRKWLELYPYAALGALIFPGILTAVPGRPWLAVGAGVLAAACSLLVRNLTVAVLVAICFVLVAQHVATL